MDPLSGFSLYPATSLPGAGGGSGTGTQTGGEITDTSDTTTVSGAGQGGESSSTNDTDAQAGSGNGAGGSTSSVSDPARFSEPAVPFVDLRDIPRLSLPDPEDAELALLLARATAIEMQNRENAQRMIDDLAAGVEPPRPELRAPSDEGFAIAQRYGADPQTGDVDVTS